MRLIDADALIEKTDCLFKDLNSTEDFMGIGYNHGVGDSIATIKNAPTIEAEPVKRGKWIPVTERLPNDIRPVIVTWKNTAPEPYYRHIVGKHFTGTACYKNGKWYWYSSITEDMLAEYGRYDSEEFDEAIECIAWMPLPEPYKEEGGA